MKFKFWILFSALCLGQCPVANAAVGLDRTRVIYDEAEKSISLSIQNSNKQLPFLAQAWLENKEHKKEEIPFAVLPPLQRLEADTKSMVRLEKLATISKLPQDRESIFYFNLREIPPKNDKPNSIQLAMQTQIKMFYRPKSIKIESNTVWQDQLIMHRTATGFRVENPTPYYITITKFTQKESAVDGFNGFMIDPKSTIDIQLKESKKDYFALTYINDYGGRPELKFECKNDLCQANNKPQ